MRVTRFARSNSKQAGPRLARCFGPIESDSAHTLILGSLPGRKSLEMQQYYAHPQNAFWKLIGAIFGSDGNLPYERGVRILTSRDIALWDVLAAAERPGSLDSAIVPATVRVNDFRAFFRGHPRLRRVLFNGRKSEQMFERFARPGLDAEFPRIRYICLPSTSPAHAGMRFAEKLDRWRILEEKPDDEPP
jgi:double-stranded uracil-DNA glycosylase